MKTGTEIDVHCHRDELVWRRGEVAKVKRMTRRRERHDAAAELRHQRAHTDN
jgi:hypothetical protein